MPVPIRRMSVEDEMTPRHLMSRRPPLRETPSTPNPHFVPLRPSPLTTRPFSSAHDDEEFSVPHVPVPLDPNFGRIAAPLPERRRTPRLVQTFEDGYLENRVFPALPMLAPSAPGSDSCGSHDGTGSTASSTENWMKGHGKSASGGPVEGEEFGQVKPRRGLSRPSSIADLRKRASLFITRSPSSLHLAQEPSVGGYDHEKVDEKVEEERSGRRRSVAKIVLGVFKLKSKRNPSVSVEVPRTMHTRKDSVEQASPIR